jgi:predicted aldo/keto reductase-like oxidoreductase
MGTEKSDLTRRKFLRTSLTGLAAAGLTTLGPGLAAAQETAEDKEVEKEGTKEDKKAERKMIYRKLGKTGIELPIVGMGAMNADNPEIVQASYEIGVRHFDTASLYAFGRNEQMLGKVINELGVRDKVVIGTKQRVVPRSNQTSADVKAKFIKLTEGSLKRLNTDYVDIMYAHSVQGAEDLDNDGVYEAMDQLKKDGKIRATGLSTHTNMAEIIAEATKRDLCDVILTSINVSMADDTALLEAIDKAAAKGIGIVAMKTQAGGRQLANQESLSKYDNATINTAMLKWVMRHESVATAIPGYTGFEHMNQDVSVAFDLEYTEEEKRFLADNELQMGLGFCRQCRQCLAGCPHGVNVPELMRTHMYAAQYSNFRQARVTLDGIASGCGIKACEACDVCTAKCANAVDVAYRIEELKLIYA